MPRNTVISICKGIAIILMVVGHAEAPGLLTNFIYVFHMPLFFMTAGYFFSRKYLDDPWTFCCKRVQGLYIPCVKWSIIFLLLHNLFFEIGLLNEQYGNWSGGVIHPYTWRVACQRLVMIIFSMSGYDEFLLGAFWFFRGLFVASILFLILYKVIENNTPLKGNRAVALICILAVAFTAFRIVNSLKITNIPQGGMRDIWGLFFFGLGYLFRQYQNKVKEGPLLFVVYAALLLGAAKLHFHGMNHSGILQDLWTLPLTGMIGFLMVHYIAGVIDRKENGLKRLLVFIGDNTVYIFIFHIIAFKVVSLLKINYYDLDPAQIGCHMVIHDYSTDLFWILYSIAGVSLPLIVLTIVRTIRKHSWKSLFVRG